MVIYGNSELHLNVLLQRMAKRNNVHVDTKLPKISYRETITKNVSDYYRHKKQSGGAGEFAEVHFRMKPYRDGEEAFSFVNALHGDGVRRQFVPSVEKGCRAIMEDGILTGSPVIWVEVEFYDGKDHPVDGKDVAFQKAAKECFKKCFLAAGPALLEPNVNIEVVFPVEFAGDISQYLNSHRGRIQGMDHSGTEQAIRALIPLAEVQTFSSDLRSMTQGQGTYEMDFAGYEQVPMLVQQQVIEQHQKDREES
jgi:elongation factor G